MAMPRPMRPAPTATNRVMTAPRPQGTAVDPPRGCGPAWERPGARPAVTTPRPQGTAVDPPRGCGPAWERPGARPASCLASVEPLAQFVAAQSREAERLQRARAAAQVAAEEAADH